MRKLLLLNGPEGCGKTDVTKHFSELFECSGAHCKIELWKDTCESFNIDYNEFMELYNNRNTKEVPHKSLTLTGDELCELADYLGVKIRDIGNYHPEIGHYISPRSAMIYTSECVMKPAFGNDYYGVLRMQHVIEGRLSIDDSTGFTDELPPAIEELGQENIMLVRVRGRGGYIKTDSRGYIPDGVIDNTWDIENDKTLDEFIDVVHSKVLEWLNE